MDTQRHLWKWCSTNNFVPYGHTDNTSSGGGAHLKMTLMLRLKVTNMVLSDQYYNYHLKLNTL